MIDNLKKQLLKKAKNAEFYEFESGTAIVAKHKALLKIIQFPLITK